MPPGSKTAGSPGRSPRPRTIRWPTSTRRRPGAVAARCSRRAATLGRHRPYAVDTIEPPFENPWKAPLFFGDHDFLPDGTAMLCTIQGDVWRVEGLDESLPRSAGGGSPRACTRRSGWSSPMGCVHVLGRDQITRLHDLNGDGEADFYECVSNAYRDVAAGHDFICGLQRDPAGTSIPSRASRGSSGSRADGKTVEVLATGFRNPDGLGLVPRAERDRPLLGGGMDPGVDGLRGPARRPLRLRRAERRPAAGPAAGLPPARPG